ncbi:type III secretion system translocon subunit SctE [Pandoraea sp. PE-S2T-3]|uniref:type III secretion system translocon subunit SctE n=1 Tax=Pandoraea sp. PE-S2T-3 TaxID=1986993 RepID=UPI000B400F05|nr:type III secretion system translocon subunit SctE [Pandoraea sp. PE-S2T-3]
MNTTTIDSRMPTLSRAGDGDLTLTPAGKPVPPPLVGNDNVLRDLLAASIDKTPASLDKAATMSDAPALQPPRTQGETDLTALIGRMMQMLGNGSLAEIETRLAQWQAQESSKQTVRTKEGEAFMSALRDAKDALSAYESAAQVTSEARTALDRARDKLAQTQAALDAAAPDTPEAIAAKTAHDTAKAEFDAATKQFDDAKSAQSKAHDAATAAVKKSDALLSDLMSAPEAAPGEDGEQHLEQIKSLLAMMAMYAKLLGDSAQKAIEEDMKFFETVRDAREKDLEKRNADYRDQVKKAEQLNRTMGWLGKILGAVITIVGIVGAALTGGLTTPLVVMGGAMLTDTTVGALSGFSLLGEALKPLMASVIQPLAAAIGGAIGGLLEKMGVAKETAEIIGGVIGAVVAAIAIIAVLALTMVVGSAVASKLGGTIGNLIGETVKKIVPDLIRESIKAGSKLMNQAVAAISSRMGVNEGSGQVIGNVMTKVAVGGELGLTGTQAGGQVAAGVFDKNATDLTAEMEISRQTLDKVSEWVKQAAQSFTSSDNFVTNLLTAMSDAAKNQNDAGRFILNNVRA